MVMQSSEAFIDQNQSNHGSMGSDMLSTVSTNLAESATASRASEFPDRRAAEIRQGSGLEHALKLTELCWGMHRRQTNVQGL